MKTIAILLRTGLQNNSRATNPIKTMSQNAIVDVFYINENGEDNCKLFNKNVKLFPLKKPKGKIAKIHQNLFFTNEYLFYIGEILKTGEKYDFIWAVDLPFLKPAIKLKKKLNSKLVYESLEIYYETVNQFFDARGNRIKKIVFSIIIFLMKKIGKITERKYIKKVDCFVTTCTSFKNYFQKKYPSKDIKIVMNCPPFQMNNDKFDFRTAYNIPENTKIAIFQGTINKGRALYELINAIKFIKSDTKLIILGNGILKKNLIEIAEKENFIAQVIFIDPVPSSELLKYTRGADFGINLQAPDNLSKKLASANKLYEYLHANIPIIASDMPENRIVLEKYKVGVLIENEPQKIAKAIDFMATSDLSEYKENCKRAALEYNWENQEKIILDIINS